MTTTGARGGTAAVLLAVAAAAAAVVAAAVLVDDDQGGAQSLLATTTTAPSTTVDEPTSSTESDALVAELAEGIRIGSGGVLTHSESECVARGVLAEVGVEELAEIGLSTQGTGSPEQLLDELPPEVLTATLGAMLDCVPPEKLAELGGAPDEGGGPGLPGEPGG